MENLNKMCVGGYEMPRFEETTIGFYATHNALLPNGTQAAYHHSILSLKSRKNREE